MSRQDVCRFLDAYRDAFNRLDGAAVADFYAVPSGIRSGDRIAWWTDAAPILDNMQRLCDSYRRAGFAGTEYRLGDHVALGDDDAFVNVHWTLRDAAGATLQAFSTAYNLRRASGDAAIHVVLCTAYQERLMN